MTEQGYGDNRFPPASPARPSVEVGTTPSQTAARPRPRGIDFSYRLWFGACLVGLLTVVGAFVYFGQLHADMLWIVERQFPNEDPVTRDRVATAAVGILIGAGLLIVLVLLGFAVAMRAGHGWTRFALVLLALLGAGYTLMVFNAAPNIAKVGLLVTVAMMVLAAVPMFLRDAQEWFAHRSLMRSGPGGDPIGEW